MRIVTTLQTPPFLHSRISHRDLIGVFALRRVESFQEWKEVRYIRPSTTPSHTSFELSNPPIPNNFITTRPQHLKAGPHEIVGQGSFVEGGGTSHVGLVVRVTDSTLLLTFTSFITKPASSLSRSALRRNEEHPTCVWNGSALHIERSSNGKLESVTIANCSGGGMTVMDSTVTIILGGFRDDNRLINDFPSTKRNILCRSSKDHELNVVSLGGGDGVEAGTSM